MKTDSVSQDIDAVLEAERRRYGAMREADVAALEKLLHPDLVYVHSLGEADSRDSYLDKLRRGSIAYAQVATDDVTVKVHGNCALVFARMCADALLDGQPRRINNRSLAVWNNSDGPWRLVAYQPTVLPASPADVSDDQAGDAGEEVRDGLEGGWHP